MNEEALFINDYEAIYKAVDRHYDIRGSALSALVKTCLESRGQIPHAQREKFRKIVPEEYFDYIETATKAQLDTHPIPQ